MTVSRDVDVAVQPPRVLSGDVEGGVKGSGRQRGCPGRTRSGLRSGVHPWEAVSVHGAGAWNRAWDTVTGSDDSSDSVLAIRGIVRAPGTVTGKERTGRWEPSHRGPHPRGS